MSEKVLVTKDKLDSLADTIGYYSGVATPLTLSEMEDAVESIFPISAEDVDFNGVINVKQAIENGIGNPLTANTASAMTDNTKVYIYTGSETGYTAGNWYYWDGVAWVSGGVYNSAVVETDKSLSISDKAADGKATGDMIKISASQPTESTNKLWIENLAEQEYEVPLYSEFTDLKSAFAYQENEEFIRRNYFDISGDINRRRDGTQQDSNKSTRNGNVITINVSNSNSYGVGQLITVPTDGTFIFKFNVDDFGNGVSISSKVYDINNYTTPVAEKSVSSISSVAIEVALESNKTYLFGWFVYQGTSPCGGKVSNVSIYDPKTQSNAELLKITKTLDDTLKIKSDITVVLNNESDFGDGGLCFFEPLNYATRRGYEKTNGTKIFPIPSINAPVQHDIPKTEILSVIKSYVDRSDLLYGDVDFPVNNPKPGNLFADTIDVDGSGNHYINCVAYMGAIIRGIRYDRSRYVISENLDGEYSTYRDMPGSTSQYFSNGWLNTYELAQYFAEQKQLYYYTEISRLQFGDIIFFTTDSEPYNDRYFKLSHCAFVLDVIPGTNYVLVTECTSTGASLFGEQAGKPFINLRNISTGIMIFARPNYNIPYIDECIFKSENGNQIRPHMTMGMSIYVDSDITKQGYIDGANIYFASCRDYFPVISGTKLKYSGQLSDGGNLHIVRAIFYDGSLKFTRYQNIAYGGSSAEISVGETEKYVRFLFQTAPSSYTNRRAVKFSDIFNFSVSVLSVS